jgi:hypothetical protein
MAPPEPESARRVGFGPCFSVKLGVLWVVESGLPPVSEGGKHFKWLKKTDREG